MGAKGDLTDKREMLCRESIGVFPNSDPDVFSKRWIKIAPSQASVLAALMVALVNSAHPFTCADTYTDSIDAT